MGDSFHSKIFLPSPIKDDYFCMKIALFMIFFTSHIAGFCSKTSGWLVTNDVAFC